MATGILRGGTFFLKKYKETKVDDVLLRITQSNGIYNTEAKISIDE